VAWHYQLTLTYFGQINIELSDLLFILENKAKMLH